MWLLLCDPTDTAALWACEGLRARGLCPLEVVTSDALAFARWLHRVGPDGAAVQMVLPDGRTLASDQVRGTLNRLVQPPRESLVVIQPSDRDYVTQELHAFYMSWLSSLPGPLLGRPTPQSLCGRIRHVSEWLWLAGRAGLQVPAYRRSGHDPPEEFALHVRLPSVPPPQRTKIVVGREVVGPPAPAGLDEACLRLAELARMSLLGLEFAGGSRENWLLAGVTGFPDLRLGGEPLLDALASTLLDGREGAG